MACSIFTLLVVASSLLLSVSDARPIQDTLPPQTAPVNTPTNSLEEFSFSTWRMKEEEKELTSPPMEGKGKGEDSPGKAEQEEGPQSKEEGKKDENEHRSFDKSKTGGEIILGGFATAVFAVVVCYIRVTRRRSHEDEEDPKAKEEAAATAETPTVIKEEPPKIKCEEEEKEEEEGSP